MFEGRPGKFSLAYFNYFTGSAGLNFKLTNAVAVIFKRILISGSITLLFKQQRP